MNAVCTAYMDLPTILETSRIKAPQLLTSQWAEPLNVLLATHQLLRNTEYRKKETSTPRGLYLRS